MYIIFNQKCTSRYYTSFPPFPETEHGRITWFAEVLDTASNFLGFWMVAQKTISRAVYGMIACRRVFALNLAAYMYTVYTQTAYRVIHRDV
jgi:hypothetical protein